MLNVFLDQQKKKKKSLRNRMVKKSRYDVLGFKISFLMYLDTKHLRNIVETSIIYSLNSEYP